MNEGEAIKRALCDWFEVEGRDLPWRRTRDPYAIWISEAMLQQTRVEAVLGHYARFLAALPDVRALAAATEERVVALWSGLGYYRRARALRKAAIAIVDEHGGEFPRERDALLALPGIGPYTAGAVASIAFDAPVPLVDGNVTRVLARIAAIDDPPGGARERRSWELADRLVRLDLGRPNATPRAWNQSLMELGALVCTARSPSCERCPVATACAARAQGRVDELPRRAERRAPIDVELEVCVVRDGDRVLLVRRPDEGRMAGMLELPTRELAPAVRGTRTKAKVVADEPPATHLWPARHALAIRVAADAAPLAELSHAITHHRIRARVVGATLARRSRRTPERAVWVPVDELGREGLHGLTGLTRKIVRRTLSSTV